MIMISLILGGIGIFYKNSNIDCSYKLENGNYNKELSSICKKNKIKYIAYINSEELGELTLDEYKVAKHFDFKYFDDVNQAEASTKKNIILSYLNFDKNTCYAKSIVEDAISDIFTQPNDLANIFDNEEISDNFICVNNIQTNEVIKNINYYLINNEKIVQIWNYNGEFYAKNINDYSNIDVSDNASTININGMNIESLENIEYFSTSLDNYKIILSGNIEYKFKHPTNKLELNNGNVYISNNTTNKTLLAKNIDKVFLEEYEEDDGYYMYLLDEDGNIYEESSDSKLKYQKIDTTYIFRNIYVINDNYPVAETTDGKLYDLTEKKAIEIYEREVYVNNDYNNIKYVLKIDLNDYSILMDDKDTNYKLKYSFGDYLLTKDNYLFKVSDGKIVSNNKVKEILVDNIVVEDINDMHRLYVTFENGEKLKLFDVY